MFNRHNAYHELVEALPQPGCAICRLAHRSARRFLDSVSFESVNDIDLRDRLRRSYGLCNPHAWMMLDEVRDPFGTALIYRDILEWSLWRTSDPTLLRPSARCIACDAQNRSERRNLAILLDDAETADVRAGLIRGGGLCERHLHQAVARGGRAVAAIVQAQRAVYGLATDPAWRPGAEHQSAAGSRVRVGGSLPPRVDERPVEPLVWLFRGGVQLVHGSMEDWSMAETRCTMCRAATAAAGRAIDLAGATDRLCAVHICLLARRRGNGVARAVLLPRLADLRGRLAALEDVIDRSRPLGLGPLVVPTPRSRANLARLRAALVPAAECAACSAATMAMGSCPGGPYCRAHVAALGTVDPASVEWWRSLVANLDEYLRKSDYRFRAEARGDEQRSPWRVVQAMAGDRTVPILPGADAREVT